MIENKIIEIIKENTFDRDWAIFTEVGKTIKNKIKSPSIQEIVNKITFASQIDIIFSDSVFHKRLYEAILWSFKQGGLKLNLIYKNDKILSQLKGLKFNKLEKDNDVSINYMCIKGKKNGKQYECAFLLEDNIIQLDSPINFEEIDNKKYDFLGDCETIFIIDNKYNSQYDALIEKCQEKQINIAYVIKTQNFSQEIHHKFKDQKIRLLVCDKIKPAIILLTKTNKIYCLKYHKNAKILFEISNLEYYIQDNLYLNHKNIRKRKELPRDLLCYNNGKIKNYFIQEEKTIPIEVQCSTMNDFVNENFDKSITDKHNDFSMECKVVKYKFNLKPPRFTCEYKISSIYDNIRKVASKVERLNDDLLLDFKNAINKLSSETWIEKTIECFLDIKRNILQAINNFEYSNFDKYCTRVINDLEKGKQSMFDEIINIYQVLNKGAEIVKFSKFDEEIEGYRKIIQQKEKLIEDNVEVLSNKRRIDILTKKIEELVLLKQKYESKNNDRDLLAQDSFSANYNLWLNKQNTSVSYFNSVTSVVIRDLNKSEQFEKLLEKYLYSFNDYYDKFIKLVKQVNDCLIFPLKYIVYEKNNQNYIVINSLEEYQTVKSLCKKFNLLTVAKE